MSRLSRQANRYIVLVVDPTKPGGWSVLASLRDEVTAVTIATQAVEFNHHPGSMVVDVAANNVPSRYGIASLVTVMEDNVSEKEATKRTRSAVGNEPRPGDS